MSALLNKYAAKKRLLTAFARKPKSVANKYTAIGAAAGGLPGVVVGANKGAAEAGKFLRFGKPRTLSEEIVDVMLSPIALPIFVAHRGAQGGAIGGLSGAAVGRLIGKRVDKARLAKYQAKKAKDKAQLTAALAAFAAISGKKRRKI